MSETPQATTQAAKPRPLSPHLQIYRWQITMLMSILHRATGIALSVGLIPLAWWLVAAATGPEAYAKFIECASSPVGLALLFGWSVAGFYHLFAGIRHMAMDWDMRLFAIPNIYKSGYAVWVAAALSLAAFWAAILTK